MKDEKDNNIPLTNGGDTPIPLKEDNNFNAPDNFIQSLKLSQGHKSCADALLTPHYYNHLNFIINIILLL